ncbi:MAG: hypothetical protein AB7G93_16135 [Bdellovibrionales bacterium]
MVQVFTLVLVHFAISFAVSAPAESPQCKAVGGGDGGALGICKQRRCMAETRCREAAEMVKVGSDTAAQAVGVRHTASDKISVPAFELADVSQKSKAAYEKAVTYCRERKSDQCDQSCDPSKDQNKAKELEQEKKGCNEEIGKTILELQKGGLDAQTAENKSDNTGKQSESGGMPPGQAPQGGGGSGSEDSRSSPPPSPAPPSQSPFPSLPTQAQPTKESKEPAAEPQAGFAEELNCTNAQASSRQECISDIETYCGPAGSAAGTSSLSTDASGASSTVKAGAGLGSAFCRQHLAGDFCVKNPSRKNCGRCAHLYTKNSNLEASELQALCNECSDYDPMFADPTIAQACTKKDPWPKGAHAGFAPTSVGASAGGGTTSQSTAASGEVTLDKEAMKEATSQFKNLREGLTAAVDGGGGGSSGSEGSYSNGSSSSYGSLTGLHPGSMSGVDTRSISSTGEAAPSDVETQFGPNVFSISSAVIQARCSQGKFLHCGPRK